MARKNAITVTLSALEEEAARYLAHRADRSVSYITGKAILAMIASQDIKAYQTLKEKHKNHAAPAAPPDDFHTATT